MGNPGDPNYGYGVRRKILNKHLTILKQGIKKWNQWRIKNSNVRPALKMVDLRGAFLAGANLENANLEGSYLAGANLKNTNLKGAILTRANLSDCDLTHANLSEVNFDGAILKNVNFSHTNLSGFNFSEYDLSGVKFRGTNLSKVNFSRANLSDCDLSHANLSEVNFDGAILTSSNAEESVLLLRYTNIQCPNNSIIHFRLSLFVQLLLKPLNPNTKPIEIEDTEISKLPEIEIVLRAKGCDIQGGNTKIIQVEREDDTEERFVLIPRQLGEQEIRVDFYQNGRRIGTARKNIIILAKEESKNVEVSQPQVQTTLEIKNKFSVPPPDLELCVQLDKRDHRTLDFTIHSTKSEIDFHHKKVGQVILESSPEQKMQSVYQELGHLAQQVYRKLEPIDIKSSKSSFPDNQNRAEERLISVGNQLWDELIPDELKQQYWQFKSVVKSLLITSDEPWIPWEMIKPYRFNNGKEEQDLFWCEQFALSRWLSGPGTADDFPAELLLTVAPTNTNLLFVQQEVAFFQKLNSLRSSIACVPTISNVSDLQNYIREPKFSILHFACHGMFDTTLPNDSAIQLTDGAIRPSDIRLSFTNLRSLVFINACHGGRVGFSFTKIGGWAEKFVNARVGVFIGAMWEVNDELACQFAETFYTALLKDNLTVAQAFQKSRQAIREAAPHNSTWLAYSLYADPEARIKEDSEAQTKPYTLL